MGDREVGARAFQHVGGRGDQLQDGTSTRQGARALVGDGLCSSSPTDVPPTVRAPHVAVVSATLAATAAGVQRGAPHQQHRDQLARCNCNGE